MGWVGAVMAGRRAHRRAKMTYFGKPSLSHCCRASGGGSSRSSYRGQLMVISLVLAKSVMLMSSITQV